MAPSIDRAPSLARGVGMPSSGYEIFSKAQKSWVFVTYYRSEQLCMHVEYEILSTGNR
jgi:hypothetical protein